MSENLSHSSMTKYITCPRSYELRYKKRLASKYKGSALIFGVAVDVALEYMLNNKDAPNVLQESLFRFNREIAKQPDNCYIPFKIAKSLFVTYSKADFDISLLTERDFERIDAIDPHALEIREAVLVAKKEGFPIHEKNLLLTNYMAWLSLRRKGHLLVRAYFDQILPKIKKVLGTQIKVELNNSEGDKVTGFIDVVADLYDYGNVLLDNKTSSVVYTKESVGESEQLGLYQIILNEYAQDPKHEWQHFIEKAGYLVVNKKIRKEIIKVCETCSHTLIGGAHATCNNMIEKKRCGGTWIKTVNFKVDTQIIVDTIQDEMLDNILNKVNNITSEVKAGNFEQNFNGCQQYWGKCEFFNLCHHNKTDDLVNLPEKKK